jgi:hypothetical protein
MAYHSTAASIANHKNVVRLLNKISSIQMAPNLAWCGMTSVPLILSLSLRVARAAASGSGTRMILVGKPAARAAWRVRDFAVALQTAGTVKITFKAWVFPHSLFPNRSEISLFVYSHINPR